MKKEKARLSGGIIDAYTIIQVFVEDGAIVPLFMRETCIQNVNQKRWIEVLIAFRTFIMRK
jgi:hypothetical protein